jgi:hypothetical protein
LVVRPLPIDAIIRVDGLLAEWNESFKVLGFSARDAHGHEWRCIRDYCPQRQSLDDLTLTVHMAWDDEAWYIGMMADDDHIVPEDLNSERLYGGDCIELFFAGSELNSDRDFHEHVESPSRPAQAAFFQLELAPVAASRTAAAFPSHRTDARFISEGLSTPTPLAIQQVIEGKHWSAEARIPLVAFEEAVRVRIRGGSFLRFNLDYLDYDEHTAGPPDRRNHFRFMPDNVFCLDSDEDHVNIPARMRQLVFRR